MLPIHANSQLRTGEPSATDPSQEAAVRMYHDRTKHHPNHYAASLGYLDWDTQPDPFRRYRGTELLRLRLPEHEPLPHYAQLYTPGGVAPAALTVDAISRFFRYALSVSAWKRAGSSSWALRVNPSSGNLHPTEAYAVLPGIEGVSAEPGLYHYAPKEHALERRAVFRNDGFRELCARWPAASFLIGLSSIHWREAWKYGERAFRYCQHDLGHALAALRVSAAMLGWRLICLDGVANERIGELLGLNRDEDYAHAEREEPGLLALVSPNANCLLRGKWLDPSATQLVAHWFGRANALSSHHLADWAVIDEVAAATRGTSDHCINEDFEDFPEEHELRPQTSTSAPVGAAAVVLARRSATAMDARTSISKLAFFHMLSRLMPSQDSLAMPWDALSWRPRIHLGLFVHRVEGLPAGLFAMARDPERGLDLKDAMNPRFIWERVDGCPTGLALYLLERGDFRQLASSVSCRQELAGDGAFSLAMLAEFEGSLNRLGAWFYRRLFWEAGMVGHVLYLEAQAVGLGATGIGCYFDDQVHSVFGLSSASWQSLYHFTVGQPVLDPRLTTLPAYE